MENQIEREERLLDEERESGNMTEKEYSQAMRELHRDYQASAEQSAQEAYDRELSHW